MIANILHYIEVISKCLVYSTAKPLYTVYKTAEQLETGRKFYVDELEKLTFEAFPENSERWS